MSADLSHLTQRGAPTASALRNDTILSALRAVVDREGLLGLYRGFFISAIEIMPFVAISLGDALIFFYTRLLGVKLKETCA